jgi:hypothetical protein
MKKALIVGINNYPTSLLHGCINDATEVANLLETNGDGSRNFDVKLRTDVPTKSELKGMIRELFKGDNDIALLYFSGHGSINDLGGYIVTPDHTKDDLGVSMEDILKLANESEAKNRIVILDCCFSGNMGSPMTIGGEIALIKEGVTILTASRDSEYSMEIRGHGVFTQLLLDALQGGAADLNGHITPGSIYAFIDQALGAWDQRPIFKTNITRFTSLRTIKPKVSIEVMRKITEYFPEATDPYKLDPSYEDTNSLTIEHKVVEPFADPNNVTTFKNLQKLQSVGLVEPVDAKFMYFAAMESKACRLTSLGYLYWKLVKNKRI